MERKVCPACGFEIFGRTDKVFCSDKCRTNHNKVIYKKESQVISPVNSILKRNRRILLHLLTAGKHEVSKELLENQGFDFQYFTSLEKNDGTETHYYCYDVSYMIEDSGNVKIVKQLAKK